MITRSLARNHVGVFERLVVAFGDREHRHFMRFAEIKFGRADEVADVFDKDDRVFCGRERVKRTFYHGRIQMAALAGIDLERPGAGRTNAVRIVVGFLVAFNHHGGHIGERLKRCAEEFCLSRSRARDEVERERTELGKARAGSWRLRHRCAPECPLQSKWRGRRTCPHRANAPDGHDRDCGRADGHDSS